MTWPGPVTVLMPARDAGSTVALAIRDLLAGMWPTDELLVVDDGSQDNTAEVLRKLASSDGRVQVLRTTGVGLVSALNLGLREASNTWIARADADDRYPEQRLERQRALVRPGVALVGGDYEATFKGKSLGVIPSALGSPFVALSLVNPQRIAHPGVMYSRDAVLAAGGYREADFPAEDLALWMRLMHEGDFVSPAELVVHWQMSAGSVSHRSQSAQRRLTGALVANLRSTVPSVSSDQLEEELARYSASQLGIDRVILLARDLGASGQFGPRSAVTRLILRELGASPLGSLRGAYHLVRGQIARHVARAGYRQAQQ